MATKIRVRRGTAAQWSSANPVLALGEIGWVTDGERGLKIGDGITTWNSLAFRTVPPTRTITAGTGLTGGGDLSANRTLSVAFGTAAGTVAEGSALTAETTRATAAEAALDGRLDAIEGDYATGTALTAEGVARLNADSALATVLADHQAQTTAHEADTTNIHGIADATLLLPPADSITLAVSLPNKTGPYAVWQSFPQAGDGQMITGFYGLADFLEYAVPMAAGTWSAHVWATKASDGAIIDVTVDGVAVATIDLYAAAVTLDTLTAISFAVATAGVKRVQFKVTGQNEASSSSVMRLQRVDLGRAVA